jgi:rfaE bifunctional protein nucleotidyltransferase chain/domain
MRHHQLIQSKIHTLETLLPLVESLKYQNKSIVFTNGCFDILHKGHVDYLAKAADKGDFLIVGINTDFSVKRLGKSPSRPIQDEEARAYLIAALESVSFVILFNDETPINLISSILPHILVKGADYNPESIVGYKEVIENGGRVETIAFIDGYSTTAIENKIKST